jgi:adenosylmethionine-8-amino-7-oxononanoate aminotransferase
MGRTGEWFACNHFDIIPDIVTLGKGLGGGVIALSALGVKETHFNAIKDNSGSFMHGGTFSHHPVAAAAGVALIKILEQEKLVERVRIKGQHDCGEIYRNTDALPGSKKQYLHVKDYSIAALTPDE